MKKVLLATNNQGKVERFKHLLKQVDKDIEVYTPTSLGIEVLDGASEINLLYWAT